jgi:hypothetical protein
MILDTDCRVVVDPWADISLADSSSKVAMLLIQHLKQRRERLRKIAITHLSTSDPRELRVTDHELPDTMAAELWSRLQSQYQKGTIGELSDGLNPTSQLEAQHNSRQSIFHFFNSPRDA